MRQAIAGLAVAGTLLAPAHTAPVSHTAATCAAFRTWEHHKTSGNLARLYRLSKSAHEPVKTDVTVVYYEVRQNDWYDLKDDIHWLTIACRGK